MSRTLKDKSDYLKGILRNEEELSHAYVRDKNNGYKKNYRPNDRCLDCNGMGKKRNGICRECGDESIEDLISIYESMNAY